jgi:hemerythrin
MYEMKPEFFTNIEFIDREHKKLFDLAEQVYQLKKSWSVDKFDDIRHVLRELFDYTSQHFQDEERYMEEIGYKRLFTQKIQHKEFVDRLEQFWHEHLEDDEELQADMIQQILDFLSHWLIEHILHQDMLINK